MRSIEEIIVIGSGNWGLALATLFASKLRVRVWAIDQATARQLESQRDKPGHYHATPLPARLKIEVKYSEPFDQEKSLVILAVPSSQMHSAATELGRSAERPLVLTVSKGFDVERQCTMSEVIKRAIPGARVAVLTGPTIANEVARGLPTRAVLAGEDLTSLALVKDALKNDVIALEVSRFPSHHEICAALKGLVAIAVGLADGLELGTNAQGVIMTAGLRELATVGSFFGVPESVAYGVSGAGDLITTCISPESRNRKLGALLATGLTLEQALETVRMTVEGVAMARTIETLWSLDVSIPLFRTVNSILRGECGDIRKELTELIQSL